MNLLTMLLGSFASDASVNSLSHKTGVSSSMLTKLIPLAIPILLKALTNNASSAGGAQSLLTALGQHSNKRSMAQQIDAADAQDGAKIVNHIFGKDTDKIIGQLAGQTDLTTDQVSGVLSQMAPAMMSGVSEATTQAQKGKDPAKAFGVDLSDGFDMKDVMGILGSASSGKGGPDLLSMLLKASK